MYNPSILIVSKRRELAVKYKKILKLLMADVTLVNNLSDAMGELRSNEFEFIIISDTIEENLKNFIKKVRILTYDFRPTIIAISKSAELSDKLDILNSGADDFLSEAMPNKEFQARLNAHIRRHIENLTNPMTGFLSEKLTRKTLKQIIKKKAKVSVILLEVDGIETYSEIYGDIAKEKMIQTLSAIISSAITKEDSAGHILQNKIIIFTNPYKAEKLAEFLAYAFDNVLDKFYSKYDYENNFVTTKVNSKEEKKSSLIKLIESVIEIDPDLQRNENDILRELEELIKPLRNSKKSTYIIERPKLYGEIHNIEKNKILIMENDEALNLLIETTCVLNGYNTKVSENYGSFMDTIKTYEPDLIILDYGSKQNKSGITALDKAKEYYEKINKKMPVVIFSTNILNKKEILSHGADYYLPKPYDIQTLIDTINAFLK